MCSFFFNSAGTKKRNMGFIKRKVHHRKIYPSDGNSYPRYKNKIEEPSRKKRRRGSYHAIHIRNIKPPTIDYEYRKVLKTNKIEGPMHKESNLRSIHDEETVRLFKRAPSTLSRLVRDGKVIICNLDYFMLVPNLYSYNNIWLEKLKDEMTDGRMIRQEGLYVDFGNLLNQLLPSAFIGRSHNSNDRKLRDHRTSPKDAKNIARGVSPNFTQYEKSTHFNNDPPDLRYDNEYDYPFYDIGSPLFSLICIRDYLTIDEIIGCYKLCGDNLRELPAFLLCCCHHKALNKSRQQKDKKEKPPDQYLVHIINSVAMTIANIMSTHRREQGLRVDWALWNPFREDLDVYYTTEMRKWRKDIRDRYVTLNRVSDFDKQLHYEEMERFCYVMIMLGSELSKDETTEQTFMHLINERGDPMQFMRYIQMTTLARFLDHFEELFNKGPLRTNGKSGGSGNQNKKALSLVNFLIPLIVIYNGKIPENDSLRSFPEIGDKKMRVALNGGGLYFGVGGDRYCLDLVKTIINQWGKGKGTDKAAQQLLKYVIPEAGYNFNDDIAEMGQQHGRGDKGSKEWAYKMYAMIANENMYVNDNMIDEILKEKRDEEHRYRYNP